MPKERYGQTQVREITLTKEEVLQLAVDDCISRMSKPYDFDYKNPLILHGDNGSVIIRFVQKQAVHDTEARALNMKRKEQNQ